ncbi:lipopolysaccharide biosynthesis protein [Lachnoclostridium pacaense]|uniref:lipopolysaccharide biosynthesis protein n=1 Tax=Enterocloster hominis (ex Hitch et al. 2024) TaxID=1917870 RepID=UPI001D1304A0|nr:lipopolysaccharide biosynthesis protein [Lachnoclostridium pacaense]MCC2878101.1 lipopolysaccharide biosynthesis protein [Lachnoclostridium pacaense]
MRTEKSIRNIVYGEVNVILTVLLSMVTRTALVRILGLSAVSLNGLFTEVIAVLSLAELGVGSAITYNLYKPLAGQDEQKLTQLMWFYKSAYRLIAGFILAAGLCFLPFVSCLIRNAEYDMGYLRLVYVIFLLKTVSSYFFSYKRTLLDADQKMYLISAANTLFRFITVASNLAVLMLTHNFIAYLLSDVGVTLANNVAIAHIADRQYPFLKKRDRLPTEEKKKIFANMKHIFIGTLSGKITNSTDNILISVLVGTLQVGLYSNYSLIISNVRKILLLIPDAAAGSIGNLAVSESRERCHQVLCRMTFIIYLVTTFCSACILCMSDPFVEILFGRKYLMDDILQYSFVVNFFYFVVREPLWRMMMVSGLFAKDKNISILGSSINLVVSIVLGLKWGILGIMLGTTCTLIIQIILKTRLLYREFLYLDAAHYQWLLIKISAAAFAGLYISKLLCHMMIPASPYGRLWVYFMVACIVSVSLNVVLFYRTEEFIYCRNLAVRMLKEYVSAKGK